MKLNKSMFNTQAPPTKAKEKLLKHINFLQKEHFDIKQPPLTAKEKLLKHIYSANKSNSIFKRIFVYATYSIALIALFIWVYTNIPSNTTDEKTLLAKQLENELQETEQIINELVSISEEEEKIEF